MWLNCRVKTGADPSIKLKSNKRGAVSKIVLNIFYKWGITANTHTLLKPKVLQGSLWVDVVHLFLKTHGSNPFLTSAQSDRGHQAASIN